MKVGVLKDIKVGEYRVIATPAEVSMLVGDGNEVYVQKGAGEGSGFSARRFDDKQPLLAVNPGNIAPGKGNQTVFRKQHIGFVYFFF